MDFLTSFLQVAEKDIIIFIFIALGFVCQRIGFLSDDANKCLANITMYFVTPCVIINAFSTLYDKKELTEILKNIGIVAIIALLTHLFMIAAVCLIFRLSDEDKRRIMRFGAVFSNAGFIALPLAQALIDTPTSREGSLYAAVYLAIFNVVLWTWGLSDMSRDKKVISVKKILTNPGIIGVVFGMVIFTSPLYLSPLGIEGIVLPSVITDALSYMSAINLPVPMLMVGYYLGKADLKRAFREKWAYICMVLRLVVFPLVLLLVLWLVGIRGNVMTVSVIGACAPVGATLTMFAAKFDRDTTLSVSLVSLSTIISLLTMPLIVGLTQMIA